MTTHEIDSLKAFAKAIMAYWPESGIDDDQLQELAVKHGLLERVIQFADCSVENVSTCQCAEYCTEAEFKKGVECFRKTGIIR